MKIDQQILLSGIVASILLTLTACAPSNYEDCVTDASTRPTELGVKVARQQCYDKFKKPAEDAAAAARAKEAVDRVASWTALNTENTTLAMAMKVMGKPAYVSKARPCAKSEGRGQTPASCIVFEWRDNSPGVLCGLASSEGRTALDTSCYFHAEFESSNEEAKLWALWEKPF